MPDNTITDTHAKSETPYAVVNLTPNDLELKDWAFLREWANRLGVSIEVLLHRILVAAVRPALRREDSRKFKIASCELRISRMRLGASVL